MGTIQGDIFNESNKGTFLTSLDILSKPSLNFLFLNVIYSTEMASHSMECRSLT